MTFARYIKCIAKHPSRKHLPAWVDMYILEKINYATYWNDLSKQPGVTDKAAYRQRACRILCSLLDLLGCHSLHATPMAKSQTLRLSVDRHIQQQGMRAHKTALEGKTTRNYK